ncbi:hypothetical protein A2635_04695 [Candidatus Peribacteria bacterium RIFCSPHIGHO2_01_FULL_51_9]|nr:MAG: hypothetical protein A2635_04695 [Candidatus Peribacteria bacterium RIFCSPHIGHO2_01_FULL_51_9]
MEQALERLRDRSLPLHEFRESSGVVTRALIEQLKERLMEHGVDEQSVIFVIILRAGLAFFNAAIEVFPHAPIAMAGLQRDEETAQAHWYYEKFSVLSPGHTVVILDPMLATGGSAEEVLKRLVDASIDEQRIYYVGVLGAPEGLQRLVHYIPENHVILGALDEGLDSRKYIVPGLGDYGDRYCGT